jgi:predicted acyl esterase
MVLIIILPLTCRRLGAQAQFDVKAHYVKREYYIPMRDSVKLFTAVYLPKDTTQNYPIMLNRTPYSVSPYGPDTLKMALGPSPQMARAGYIFAYQDVRGRMMSEGEYVNMRPHRPLKPSAADIDESSDTYDTIDWLLKNLPRHNGRVGIWGISYPGFYAAMSLVDPHPALKAASPQAPIADWFVGDDFHHHGAFFLMDAFDFFASFGKPRPAPTANISWGFPYPSSDGYRFFLEIGALPNVNKKYFQGDIAFWNDLMAHGVNNEFWRARNILPHLKKLGPAVMTVGGWFDAEDLYGPLKIYHALERENPGAQNLLVIGPWFHGGWARGDGERLGNISFASATAEYYREQIELPFFNFHLKGEGALQLPEALMFETGANAWRSHPQWPPANAAPRKLYFRAGRGLAFEPPPEKAAAFDEYWSDPARPVPFTNEITNDRSREYMIEDQRFAWLRPDVLSYESEALSEALAMAGPLHANLFIESSGTDADFVVKLIDVFPDTTSGKATTPCNAPMGGFQMLVRAEVMRAKFRNSYEKPQPLAPHQITPVRFELQDVHHRFRQGHRIMVQVQSSWFPLVDRNPQKFVDIYSAKESDFQLARQRIHRSAPHASHLEVMLLK